MIPCLSDDQIARLLADTLSEAEESLIDMHLLECPSCRDLLATKTALSDEVKDAFDRETADQCGAEDAALIDLLNAVAPLATVDAERTNGVTLDNLAANGANETAGVRGTIDHNLPGYEMLDEVGRGGLGVVFRARQTAFDRIVAIKMLLPNAFRGGKELARFRAEAQAVAQLQHPNVVQVFDIVEQQGNPCLCMEFVPGGSLSERLDGSPQPPKTAARLIEILARTIHCVHEAGLLHRDLKPANILLSAAEADTGVTLANEEGTSENIQPKITDFGLVKQLGKDSGLTDTHTALGTPSYMPPEQAREGKTVTQAADVYSLGAILYETLVGRPPFRGSTVLETMAQVLHEEPVPPRRLVSMVSIDLEAVCLKCLEKDPARRYPSAEALADDLRRFQDGQPTVARPTTSIERLWRWCRRHPIVVTSLLVVILAAWTIRHYVKQQQKAVRAEGLVEKLVSADIVHVPVIVNDLDDYRRWADPMLAERLEEAERGSAEELRLLLAVLPADEDRLDSVRKRLLNAGPDQFHVVRDSLSPYQAKITGHLWETATDEQAPAEQRFRAVGGLALFAADDARWREIDSFAAKHLVNVLPSEFLPWRNALRPAREKLLLPLSAIYRDKGNREQVRSFAADVLADFAFDRPEILFDLLADAEQFQFPVLFAKLEPHRDRVIQLAEVELQKTPRLEDGDDRLPRRQANVAVALSRMGEERRIWSLFAHRPDPRVRSYVIHWLGSRGGDAEKIITRLDGEPDVSIRRALLHCLGEFDETQLSPDRREPIITRLVEIYKTEFDPGLHSAARWLLTRWQKNDLIAETDAELAVNEDRRRLQFKTDRRQWYVNTQGQTYVVFDADEFLMGSPPWEVREQEEILHKRRIGRRLAFSTTEVTHAQYQRFRNDRRHIVSSNVGNWMRTHDSPQLGVSWFEAAEYCNWLSEAEGIPEEQWCYEPNGDGTYGPGMKAREGYLELTGYRLPTEGEWEFACRGGTVTARYYGVREELLGEYGWYMANSSDRTWPVGSRKPNDYGLFDMHGNANEWCHDRKSKYQGGPDEAVDDLNDVAPVQNDVSRVVRGGSFMTLPQLVRSAFRVSFGPSYRTINMGFRPVRTLAND